MSYFSLVQFLIVGGVLGVLVTEMMLWRLFRMRMEGLHFPSTMGPVSRMVGLGRVRVFVLIHALFLLAVLILSLLLLW